MREDPLIAELRRARRIAQLLDNEFRLFGVRFGLDPILGAIPGLGDALPLAFSAYLLALGARLGAPRPVLLAIALNSTIATLLGLVPGLGDLSDLFFKAHSRNVAILERYLARRGREETVIEGQARPVT